MFSGGLPTRVISVEYMRGLASLAVAWFHLTNSYADSLVELSGRYGWLGVEAFFVISGFVVPLAMSKAGDHWTLFRFYRFVVRRLIRLEPPYLASVALVIVLWYASSLSPLYRGSGPDIEFWQAVAHLLYAIPLTDYSWLQPVYWTLAYEFVFYLLIGALFPFIGLRGQQVRWLIACAVLAGGALLGLWPERMLLFAFGITAFRYAAHRDAPATVALATAVALIAMVAGEHLLQAIAGIATAAAILLTLDWKLPAHGKLTFLGALGAISYSLYLMHVPIGGRVINLGARFIGEGFAWELMLSFAALAVSLAAAAIFYRYVERPAIQWSKAFRI